MACELVKGKARQKEIDQKRGDLIEPVFVHKLALDDKITAGRQKDDMHRGRERRLKSFPKHRWIIIHDQVVFCMTQFMFCGQKANDASTL